MMQTIEANTAKHFLPIIKITTSQNNKNYIYTYIYIDDLWHLANIFATLMTMEAVQLSLYPHMRGCKIYFIELCQILVYIFSYSVILIYSSILVYVIRVRNILIFIYLCLISVSINRLHKIFRFSPLSSKINNNIIFWISVLHFSTHFSS